MPRHIRRAAAAGVLLVAGALGTNLVTAPSGSVGATASAPASCFALSDHDAQQDCRLDALDGGNPTPSATPTPSPTPSVTPSPSPTVTPTPSSTPDPTPTPTPSPTLPTPSPTPTSTAWSPAPGSLLGWYGGGATTDDGKATLGRYPDVASSYYMLGSPQLNVSAEIARIKRGTIPLITLSAGTSSGAGSNGTLASLAAGTSQGTAWADKAIASLKQIAAADPQTPVMFTLCHEYDVQMQNGYLTGPDADSTGALLGKALTVFIARAQAQGIPSNVKFGAWFNSGSTAVYSAILKNITGVKLDWIGDDHYSTTKHAATETLAQTWTSRFAWIKADPSYVRLGSPILAAPEFGSSTTHGDASVAAYYTDIRATMKQVGISVAVMFDRDSGPQGKYQLDGGSGGAMPKALAAFKASLNAPTP